MSYIAPLNTPELEYDFGVSCDYQATRDFLRGLGLSILEKPQPDQDRRLLGSIEDNTVLIWNTQNVVYQWYSVLHLYGHVVQRVDPKPEMFGAIQIVKGGQARLNRDQIRLMWDHESEAAEYGSGILDAMGANEAQRNLYFRIFRSDFKYLMGFVQTGKCGESEFLCLYRKTKGKPLPSRKPRDLSCLEIQKAPDIIVI